MRWGSAVGCGHGGARDHLLISHPTAVTTSSSRSRSRLCCSLTPAPPTPTDGNPNSRNGSASSKDSPSSSSNSGGCRTASLSARRKERITLPPSHSGDYSISQFLRHPSGVEAMLNTRALHSFHHISPDTYRCTLHKLQFLKFEVVPVVDLRVRQAEKGCTVEMISCRFDGSEAVKQQNHLFSAVMRNHITWEENVMEPCLDFDVHLSVTLQVFTKPFTFLPISAVETPGNLIMGGLVDRLVPLLIEQILEDYRAWATIK